MPNPIRSELLQYDIDLALAPLKRRRFMALAAHTILVAGAGAVLSACSDPPVAEAPAGRVLSADQVAFFTRFAHVVLPTEGTTMTPLEQVPVLENLDHLMAGMDPDIRSNLAKAMGLFEHGSLVMGWYFSRFSGLPTNEAIAYIDAWQSGHYVQQGIISVLKKLVYASYWREPSTWGPLAFDGPVSEKWGLPSLGEAPLPVRSEV
ncbi:MAG: hypothetical protein CMK83_16785 [Pseudomonadales bacterium]|jgi:hypothetical protein|uniref:hypothetical protein n=1 Tax=unclassified Ketobacter TaxID=2639109 RepID=UPI000C5E3B7F|nr:MULTISPECIES: hypothetical protein [unclassified Ketobacter]MAQ25862.1 hypothetical protein [Pseudomonadales bacterium]MEC8810917.1 hypothetical protein [Pseudomonadota bacterium]TNC83761.1 MAG: hypothetical protein CSH49_20515 [Alcanivorax sp.]HAU15841.1 hypothetical protein [Gammaproteobacteria bacterium]MBI28035.1 hypothetical protein [Pseudomonadales bacterium]|tara:strand:- start:2777 stop:3391 length:615 start_codon:yes stop_codon:yes gene_type:complete